MNKEDFIKSCNSGLITQVIDNYDGDWKNIITHVIDEIPGGGTGPSPKDPEEPISNEQEVKPVVEELKKDKPEAKPVVEELKKDKPEDKPVVEESISDISKPKSPKSPKSPKNK